MELQQVRYFLATCEYLNFTRAAQACNVTQPALTKALKLLELELGGDLFDRQIRPMQLTELGEHLVLKFRAMHELKGEISAKAKLFNRSDADIYELGIVNTIDQTRLEKINTILEKQAPNINLSISLLSQTALRNRLREGRLEMALIVNLAKDDKAFTHTKIYEEDYVLALPHKHFLHSKDVIRLQDLDQIDYIYRSHCELNSKIDSRLRGSETKIRKKLSTDQDAIALAMIKAGQGVSIMPESLMDPLISKLPVEDLNLKRVLTLSHLPNRVLSSSAKLIKEIIIAEFQA